MLRITPKPRERFNDTMATELEQRPLAFAETTLAPSGWQVGKHAGV